MASPFVQQSLRFGPRPRRTDSRSAARSDLVQSKEKEVVVLPDPDAVHGEEGDGRKGARSLVPVEEPLRLPMVERVYGRLPSDALAKLLSERVPRVERAAPAAASPPNASSAGATASGEGRASLFGTCPETRPNGAIGGHR